MKPKVEERKERKGWEGQFYKMYRNGHEYYERKNGNHSKKKGTDRQ